MPAAGLCWCGVFATVSAIGRDWCRTHAPRCRSGAHFIDACLCDDPLTLWRTWASRILAAKGQRAEEFDDEEARRFIADELGLTGLFERDGET